MKIKDIKPFVSTDRKVHVALVNGGGKDGYLSLVRKEIDSDPLSGATRTFASIKGDRGRPSLVHPDNIDSITWHTDPTVETTEKVEKVRKSNPTKTEEVKPVKPHKHTTDCTIPGECPDPKSLYGKKPLRKAADTGKKECGCTGKLLCKAHYEAQKSQEPVGVITLTGPRTAKAGKFTITLHDDGSVSVR